MGFDNFENGQNNSMMGYYSFKNGLVNYTLWTYVLPMMACLMGKLFQLWAQYFEKSNYIMLIMGLFISHYGLMFFP